MYNNKYKHYNNIPDEFKILKNSEGWPEHAYDLPSKIDDKIYISGVAFTDCIPSWCKCNNFTHILNAAGKGLRNDHYQEHPKNLNIKYLELNMIDDEDFKILPYLDRAYKFLYDAFHDNPNAKILVHCYWGQSRSVTCVAYFYMIYYGISSKCAYNKIKSKRPPIYPNSGFVDEMSAVDDYRSRNNKLSTLDKNEHKNFYSKMIKKI